MDLPELNLNLRELNFNLRELKIDLRELNIDLRELIIDVGDIDRDRFLAKSTSPASIHSRTTSSAGPVNFTSPFASLPSAPNFSRSVPQSKGMNHVSSLIRSRATRRMAL